MSTKRELKANLEEICPDARFIKFEYESPEKFFIAIKCKVKKDAGAEFYAQFFTDWITKFGIFTATSWIVRHSFPKMIRMVFRKVYACSLSGFNKSQYCDSGRNKLCRAKIDFRIKKITKGTFKNDPLLRQDLNLNILIDFTHTHLVRDPESFNLLRSNEVDKQIMEYFKGGFGPTAAKYYHELLLVEKHGENEELLMNANLNPTMRHVTYLGGKKHKNILEMRSIEDLMADKKTTLENSGGTLIYTDNADLAVIVTPFMKRVFSELGAETLIVDSTPIHHTVVTLFYVPSRIGLLPIACALHTSQEEANYTQTFLTVKITLDSGNFTKSLDPKLVMTNELKDQINAVTGVFPGSKRMSLPFDVCRALWMWFWDDDNGLSKKKRHHVMSTFREMILAETPESSAKKYKELMSNDSVKACEKVQGYIEDVWQRRNEWAGDEIYQHCDKTTMEVSVTLMKEFIAQKVKSFTVPNIVDVIANVMDTHCCRTVQNYVKDCQSLQFLTKFLQKTKDILGFGSGTQKINAKEYRIPSLTKAKRFFTFRIDTFFCDCGVGQRGQFCEHLCGVVNVIDTDFRKLPKLTDHEKIFFAKLCGNVKLAEENKNVKVEIPIVRDDEDDEDDVVFGDIATKGDKELFEKEFMGDDEDRLDDGRAATPSSSPKHDDDAADDYYVLEVKKEKPERNDPLEELFADDALMNGEPSRVDVEPEPELTPEEFKAAYEKSMKELNNEFRRLNKLLKSNANKCNLSAMTRLTQELAKIKPVERVNLKDLIIELNEEEEDHKNAKKRRLMEDDEQI